MGSHESDRAREWVKRLLTMEHSIQPDSGAVVRRAKQIRLRRRVAIVLAGMMASIAALSGASALDLWKQASPRDNIAAEGGGTAKPSISQRIPMTAVYDVGFDDGSLWAASNGIVKRLDPSGDVVASISTPGTDYPKLGFGGGAVWVADRSGSLIEIDPKSNRVVSNIPLEGSPTHLAVDAGSAWVSIPTERRGVVLRLDVDSHKVVARISVGVGPGPITVTPAGVWVVNTQDGTLSLIDPLTNEVVRITSDLGATRCVVEDELTLWVCADTTAQIALGDPDASPYALLRLDAVTGEQLARIELDHEPSAVTISQGAVWVALNRSGESGAPRGDLLKVDPRTDKATEIQIGVDETPVALATDGTSIWIANFSSGTIEKIE